MSCRAMRENCACPLQGDGGEVKEDEEKSERTQPRQLTPQEALERIHAARVRLRPSHCQRTLLKQQADHKLSFQGYCTTHCLQAHTRLDRLIS